MPVADDGARRAIAARAGDWTRLLQDLIRIPSCFEAEHAIVARVCEHVTAIGLTPVLVPMDAEALRRNPDCDGAHQRGGGPQQYRRPPARTRRRPLPHSELPSRHPAGRRSRRMDPSAVLRPHRRRQQRDLRSRRHGRQSGRRHLPGADADARRAAPEAGRRSRVPVRPRGRDHRQRQPGLSRGRPHRRCRPHCRRHAAGPGHRSARRQHGVSCRLERATRVGQRLAHGRQRGRDAVAHASRPARCVLPPQRQAPAALDRVPEPLPAGDPRAQCRCTAVLRAGGGERPLLRHLSRRPTRSRACAACSNRRAASTPKPTATPTHPSSRGTASLPSRCPAPARSFARSSPTRPGATASRTCASGPPPERPTCATSPGAAFPAFSTARGEASTRTAPTSISCSMTCR